MKIHRFALISLILLCVPSCSKRRVSVQGASMSPTLINGDIVMVDTNAYKRTYPSRLEIVAFKDKSKGDLQVLRVLGLPGEKLELTDKGMFIDGKLFVPPMTMGKLSYRPPIQKINPSVTVYPIVISPTSFFLMGDNQDVSFDSRFFGEVEFSNLIGKVSK